MNVTYYSIYAVTEKSAANLLLKEILSKEEDVDSFTDLINLYKKNMLRGNGFERMQITVWEMTPRDTIAKERLTKIETLSIPEIHRLGKNLFKNFDQVMEKDPAYTMLNRPMIVDLRGRRSL